MQNEQKVKNELVHYSGDLGYRHGVGRVGGESCSYWAWGSLGISVWIRSPYYYSVRRHRFGCHRHPDQSLLQRMQLIMTQEFKGGPLCWLLDLRRWSRFRAALRQILKTIISFESWTEIWRWANGELHLELSIFHPADACIIGGTFFTVSGEKRDVTRTNHLESISNEVHRSKLCAKRVLTSVR